VFLELVQFIELPKRVPLSAFVRFGCVDCIYNLLPNALYYSISSGWVIRGAPADRVVHAPIRLRAAAGIQHQLVGQGIQWTPQILNYIGGNGCQLVGERIGLADAKDALSGLRILFFNEGVWPGIVKGYERKLKILDVLLGPCDFRPDSVNDLPHFDTPRCNRFSDKS
jgi:hypothetical protein